MAKIRNPVFIVFKHSEADIEAPYHGTVVITVAVRNKQASGGENRREHVLHIFLCMGRQQGCVLSTLPVGTLSISRIKKHLTDTSVHAGQRVGA